MRNKGFFWFLTILLTAVCIYQLSFTYVTSNVEADADKKATIMAKQLMDKEMSPTEDGIALLPNNTEVNFKEDADALDLAKAAYINQILTEKADKPVSFTGATFKNSKKRSLAFGLDLVGGMSVTLEISVPDLVKTMAQNETSLYFKKPFDAAYREHTNRGGDFVDLFISKYEQFNGKRKLARDLNLSEAKGLKVTSSNSEVADYINEKVASAMDGVEQIMAKRINQFGVAQPNIQRETGTSRLYIELPGVQDEVSMSLKLKSTANLEFFEVATEGEYMGPISMITQMSRFEEVITEETEEVKPVVADTTKKDGDSSKVIAPTKPLGKMTKGWSEYVKAAPGMAGLVKVADKYIVEQILNRKDVKAAIPSTLKFMFSAKPEFPYDADKKTDYVLYAIRVPETGKAYVGGDDVVEAASVYENEYKVNLSMNSDGATRWATMTRMNTGKQVAITMDGVVYSAPFVNGEIAGGSTEISGSFSAEEAKDLAGLLNGGSLPVPCVIKDQTKVGPTIGAENSSAGLMSFAIAFFAVFIYMYFYYGKSGLIANVALLVNVFLILGSLASFGAVLTLAGIAGIVLTIGTAVDANILIFERIKEEIATGHTNEEAVRVGYVKALPAIIDANMTHLLVAIILKVFGTGEVESFATTLIIGIFTSLFSAIIISKLIIYWMLERGKSINFSTKMTENFLKHVSFDWIGKRKYFYIFSISVTIIGMVALFTRGLKQSVEFTGGRSFSIQTEKPVDIEKLRTTLSTVFVEKGKEAANIEIKTKSTSRTVEIVTNYKLADENATEEVKEKLIEGLKKAKGNIGESNVIESRAISASVSNEMWKSALISIIIALIAIFAYIFIRFGQWQYSLGAIIGLAHDAFFVVSIFALLHGFLPFALDVNQAFIAAILTVIGYSMNDTVIVFDRIREGLNFSQDKEDKQNVINDALNKTLSRTFNTSMILFVVLLLMFLFGGPAIKGFLFALLIGVIIGTYSSLCVATPILIDFTTRFKGKKK